MQGSPKKTAKPEGKTGQKQKHIPQRMCLSCRCTQAKRELLRLVRTSADRVELDPTSKRNGRGAYLCLNRDCWEAALKRRGIERALRLEALHPEDRVMLQQFMQGLERAPDDDAGNR